MKKIEEVELQKRRSLSAKDKLDILNRDDQCPVCRQRVQSVGEAEFDHIIPLALGGTNEKDNFQALHANCHKLKTQDDIKAIAKTNRLRKRRLGMTRKKKAIPSRPFPKRKKEKRVEASHRKADRED